MIDEQEKVMAKGCRARIWPPLQSLKSWLGSKRGPEAASASEAADLFGSPVIRQLVQAKGEGSVRNVTQQVFVGGYERLRDVYIHPWPVFERVNLDAFVGREWLLAEVDAFLREHDRGYLILEAEAGLGKTAFLARLTKERGYVHHFFELTPGLENQECALKSLAAQLARAYLDADQAQSTLPPAAGRPSYLYNLLEQAANRHPQGKIVLVLDGLDAAETSPSQNVLCLPKVLPPRVFVIASQRPVPVHLEVDTARTHRRMLRLAASSDENRTDMRRYLERAAERPGVAQALKKDAYSQGQFVATLLQKCRGVWIYLHFVIHEIERGECLPSELGALPTGMTLYYARYWQRLKSQDRDEWYRTYLPLLSTLAAAREPIRAELLAKWAGVSISTPDLCDLLGQQWRAFVAVTGQGDHSRYRLYHATLHEFFEGRVKREDLAASEQAFVAELRLATIGACRRIMQRAQKPEDCRGAALRLARLRWLDDVQGVPIEEGLAYLELIIRYLYTQPEREWHIRQIGKVLARNHALMSRRQHTQFLVYRAILLGYSDRLGEAAGDYEQASSLINDLVAAGEDTAEDQRALARINLGAGNIKSAQGEMLKESGDEKRGREVLAGAIPLYVEAARAAEAYGQDPVLEANVYRELSYTHSLLQDWGEAQGCYEQACNALERVRETDREAWLSYRARLLHLAGNLHLQKGQYLAAQGDRERAYPEYERAHELATEAIDLLKEAFGETDDLVVAYIVGGRALRGMDESSDRPEPKLADEACQHWRTAQEMAQSLGVSELEEEARQCIEEYCRAQTPQP
jgi:tetratricopeptide (TPR) repeat protein